MITCSLKVEKLKKETEDTLTISSTKYTLHHRAVEHVTLVFGNRSLGTTIFKTEIEELTNRFASTFSVWHFHTCPLIDKHSLNFIQERIDTDKILAVLQAEGKLKPTLHYICGPTHLKESVNSKLIESGLGRRKLFYKTGLFKLDIGKALIEFDWKPKIKSSRDYKIWRSTGTKPFINNEIND